MELLIPICAVGAVFFILTYFFYYRTAFIVIDFTNDFVDPQGTLSVKGAVAITPVINKWILKAVKWLWVIVYSRDWHDLNSKHFKCTENPNGWPIHSVKNAWGSEFYPDLLIPENANILHKGMNDGDAYSVFDPGALINKVSLHDFLKKNRVKRIFFAGVATDWCVLRSVEDAVKLGYKVILIKKAVAAVNLYPGDEARALERMREIGVRIA